MNSDKCPFCGIPLFPLSKTDTSCGSCGLHINYERKEAYFSTNASTSSLESQKFLNWYFKEGPMYCVSPVKLFDDKFRFSAVHYFGPNAKQENKLVTVTDIKDGHLIAGHGLVAHKLLYSMSLFYELGYEHNPLQFTYKNHKEYLYNLVGLANMPCRKTVTADLYAYLMPTLEAMSSVVCHMPFHPMQKLTNEQVLYSAIFMQPQVQIKWDPKNLMDCVKQFLFAITDLTLSSKEMKPYDFKEYFCDFPESIYDREDARNLYNMVLKGNIATAPNECQSAFDVLENAYVKVKGPGNRMTCGQLKDFTSLYQLNAELFKKYAEPLTPMGLEPKIKCMCDINNHQPDFVVTEFWRRVNTELEKG